MNCAPHLDALARELGAFVELLEQEAATLAANQADALPPLIEQREAANRRLAALWRDLTHSLGLPPMTQLVDLRGPCLDQAPDAWRQVEELARHAERMNRLNGRLIEEQLRRTQAAVQVLSDAAGSRTLYGADGRVSEFIHSNRSIDTA